MCLEKEKTGIIWLIALKTIISPNSNYLCSCEITFDITFLSWLYFHFNLFTYLFWWFTGWELNPVHDNCNFYICVLNDILLGLLQ